MYLVCFNGVVDIMWVDIMWVDVGLNFVKDLKFVFILEICVIKFFLLLMVEFWLF